ncbi:cupin [Actinoplanes philippinensis]|uniref:Cupin domain protein n=1 Tax=Actinoplanes philippinensis TaxID=35752 RepID=A0A1I2NB56_9ACTN|nr:cupin domain-containing protein [Actinoplanes philippinensis]GIE83447.1 cupin [Actinoplanes philippinensis]SFG00310.1 Cupin domain protein [Actinoplanes philippinensis]
MTYPPPRYHGVTGEKSALYRPADTPPEYIYPDNGTRIHHLATGASTGGLFGLYRWECGPGVTGPNPHFHRTISESFYILSGVMNIYNGEKWIEAEPGDWVHVPIGGIHGFKNRSGAPVSMLLHFSPGAPRESYFEGVAHVGEMTEQERIEFYSKHDNIWLD